MIIINPLSMYPNNGIEVYNNRVGKYSFEYSARVSFLTHDRRQKVFMFSSSNIDGDKGFNTEKEAIIALVDFISTEKTMILLAQAYNKKSQTKAEDDDEDED